MKAPNDIKDLNGTKRQTISLPCSLSSLPYTGARRRGADTAHPSCKSQSSAHAATHQHPPAHWGQGFGPSSKQGAFPRCKGRKEKGKRGEGEREGAGTRGWGTAQRGSSGGTKFAGWVGNYLQTIAGYLDQNAVCCIFAKFLPSSGVCEWPTAGGGQPEASAVPLVHGGTLSPPLSPSLSSTALAELSSEMGNFATRSNSLP